MANQNGNHINKRGVLGLFKDPEELKKAATYFRDRQIEDFDAFTPFPVHGIEDAMGIKRSFLPWVTFLAGCTGGLLGLLFQWWTSAVDWPLNVGGKPLASWPAFIPVTFETTVLLAGLATAAAMIIVCGLPKFGQEPLDPSLTNDRFGLWVSSSDPKYNQQEFTEIMRKSGAYDVRIL